MATNHDPNRWRKSTPEWGPSVAACRDWIPAPYASANSAYAAYGVQLEVTMWELRRAKQHYFAVQREALEAVRHAQRLHDQHARVGHGHWRIAAARVQAVRVAGEKAVEEHVAQVEWLRWLRQSETLRDWRADLRKVMAAGEGGLGPQS